MVEFGTTLLLRKFSLAEEACQQLRLEGSSLLSHCDLNIHKEGVHLAKSDCYPFTYLPACPPVCMESILQKVTVPLSHIFLLVHLSAWNSSRLF
jgi:hypothetical protein